ncbi:tRNAHis guanylyltransferase Thg [Trema orientale]|uniref:tRNA(His) guanylyltransferase n=1 Tax=Trema orientale TaxID=63057 RepID=A0A2P5EJG6_TREOI|nr:tRNAHis guanylyltransferase Thg [Trema orientale]
MANSKYEYVKSFEVEDEVMFPNLVVVRIDGRDFRRCLCVLINILSYFDDDDDVGRNMFSEVHEFVKPNDEIALNLMNSCAASVMEEFPDVVFSYGYSDEYSFVFKKTTKFYQRRASKIQSLIVSFFTSVYVIKWKEFFPRKELRYPPSFRARLICCASIEVLQAYLSWRQNDCHMNNQHATCLHELVKHGKTEKEAYEFLKGTGKKEKHDLLFEQFGINYEKLPVMVRQGSCILKTQVLIFFL